MRGDYGLNDHMKKEIWIFAEQKSGELIDSVFGLLGEGKRLSKKLAGVRMCALVTGKGMEGLDKALGPYGAELVYYFETESPDRFHPDLTATLVADLAREKNPLLILLGATSLGSDLAPRIAARLQAALVTNCVDIKVGAGRQLEFIRPVAEEMLYSSVRIPDDGIQLATLALDVLDYEEPDPGMQAEVVTSFPSFSQDTGRCRTLEVIKGDPQTISLEEADMVVAGGRGVGDAQSFQIIHDLAEAVDATVGGSRPVVDNEVLPFERQIGRTGKSTSPRLFVGCGISGASEFTGGMERSKHVIAINTDKDAPLMKMADLGIVGDGREVIPEIIRLVREKKNQQSNIAPGNPDRDGER